MEYPFSSKGKDIEYWPSPRGQMEGTVSMENGTRGSRLDDSYSDVTEMMSVYANGGWCSSPNNVPDHLFPSFAMSPLSSTVTNFLSFDALNSSELYNTSAPAAHGDIVGSFPSIEIGDKMMVQQVPNQIDFQEDSADDGIGVSQQHDSRLRQQNTVETGHTKIARPPSQSLAEKMLRALYLFKELSGGGILAQVWVPMTNRNQYILSTAEQPYLLDQTLSGYREVSRFFYFAAESKPGCFPGLPGRVFNSKMPEWTSNVVYYNREEYLRVQYAVDHDVHGSIALPVFEDDSPGNSCCAVLELVTLKEKSNFDPEMENVCRRACKGRSI